MHRFHKWRDALNVAPDEKSLREVVREYVLAIDPGSLERMPPECRAALEPMADLHAAAVTLLHAELAFGSHDEVGQLLHEVAQTFAAASIRLSRLRTEPLLPGPK